MNKYDLYFNFRMAEERDTPEIMSFIREEWDANHILANDEGFFRYFYGNGRGGLNVFLMTDKSSGKIVGMEGLVIYGKYQGVIYASGSMLKVSRQVKIPMAGVELKRREYAYLNNPVVLACGINPITALPIEKKILRHKCGIMDQYYLINPYLSDYKIITFPKGNWADSAFSQQETPYFLRRVYEISKVSLNLEAKYPHLPYKSREYLNWRFFLHPVFHYMAYEVYYFDNSVGLLFLREIEYNKSSILLLVDFLGDIKIFSHIGSSLLDILRKEQAECISMLAGFFPQEIMEQSAFQKIDRNETDVIVPTYFEPFLNANIENYCSTSIEDMIVFKATGDQDNPKHKAAPKRNC